jgi:hypothetical protein
VISTHTKRLITSQRAIRACCHLMHPPSWKENSANFAVAEFFEVRKESCNKYCN